jgi:hypothetical protein
MLRSPWGQSRLQSIESVGDQPLLSSLEDLAQESFHGLASEELINQLLITLENPLVITQGNAHSCTMASAQVSLAMSRPAEYVRIMRDLIIDGQAQLAGGWTLALPAYDLSSDNPLCREDEALFQSALMQEVARIDSGDPTALYEPASANPNDPARLGQRQIYNELFGGEPMAWPVAVLTPELINGAVNFSGIVLALYPVGGGRGHAVSVVGAERTEDGQTHLIVRNPLPPGTPSALGQDAAPVGETMRVALSAITGGTYGGYSLLVTGMRY